VMQKLHARNRVEAVAAVRRYWESHKTWTVGIGAP